MNITSKIVALSSAVGFALQIALALVMLRYFSPEEVGTFSVISQIGFFWTTLALAQSPLSLLANHGASVFDDARQAWSSSLQRFVWLSPFAAMAVWWSGLSFFNALLWALLLSLCQLTWMLAQSLRLRMTSVWAQACVRVLPPLMAFLAAVLAVLLEWSGYSLLVAALIGYAAGSAWLFPSLLSSGQTPQDSSTESIANTSSDDRSITLRMAHTLVDALLATAIVVVWQRLYGAQETGWMAAPLRVMGFVPAVVHMAWAQVILAQPHQARINPLWVGLAGFACVAILGSASAFSLEMGWLGAQWEGVTPYLLPLVLWQGSACIVAAFSHLPFLHHSARRYSFACIRISVLQGIVLAIPIFTPFVHTSHVHLLIFSVFSAFALATITLNIFFMNRSKS